MSDPETLGAVDEALAELQATLRAERRPHRTHARALLVPLGELLVAAAETPAAETPPAELGERLERIRALGQTSPAWIEAVTEELELACAEHVRSVDPRFLALPRYDWDYTLEARRRLTARLVAARSLGLPLPERLLARVAEADRMLEQHLR